MILEEINGDVKVTLGGKPLEVGTTFDDCDYTSVVVVGDGKATFRIDGSCTVDRKGVEVIEPVAEPVITPKAKPTVVVKETFTAE